MIQKLTAVKTGKRFNLFQEKHLEGIQLEKTCIQVKLNGKKYDVCHGKTLEDSQKIMRLLKTHGAIQVKDYRC